MQDAHSLELHLLAALETRALADLEIAQARMALAKCRGERRPLLALKLARAALESASTVLARRRAALTNKRAKGA